MGQSSCVESPAMAQQRAHANEEAAAVLEAAAGEARGVSDDDVLRVLRLWAIQKNGDRKSVMPDGATCVHSETVGLLQCSGSRLEATLHTKQYPKVLELFARWMKDHRPEGHTRDFPFTSIIVNSSFAAKRHRDLNNLGPVVVKAFGEFQGGDLRYWAEDDRRSSVEALLEQDGIRVDVHSKPGVIDGNRAHQVETYTGEERFSLVFFTAQACDKVTDEVREQLVQLGFPVPDDDALNYLKGLMPTPQGYTTYADEPKVDRRSEQSKALSVLRGLQKPRKEGLTPVASRGLLARVLAKRTQGAMPSPQSELTTQKPATASNFNKPATLGGLLARVQKQNVIPSANSNVDVAGSPSPSPAQSGKR